MTWENKTFPAKSPVLLKDFVRFAQMGVFEGNGSQRTSQSYAGPLNLGAESSALCDGRKVRCFHENDLLFSDLLN